MAATFFQNLTTLAVLCSILAPSTTPEEEKEEGQQMDFEGVDVSDYLSSPDMALVGGHLHFRGIHVPHKDSGVCCGRCITRLGGKGKDFCCPKHDKGKCSNTNVNKSQRGMLFCQVPHSTSTQKEQLTMSPSHHASPPNIQRNNQLQHWGHLTQSRNHLGGDSLCGISTPISQWQQGSQGTRDSRCNCSSSHGGDTVV